MVWSGFTAIIRPCQVISVADASKDTSPDATLTVDGRWGDVASERSEGAGDRNAMQDFPQLAKLIEDSFGQDGQWGYGNVDC